ncbi:MAG: hypothetical protein COU46_01370 [Candidatus Niyogibacteria bacterium CG10_big_fil_rev_8_21_14_0_10_42_19]|uniref:Uncharacterized protein n=1 Tax=Candidatus Niyogibacteria bacterium CG10_big_fil_rev_8_21_14_0_10_42_19 TaxID=1974725 RepID=A0A2H0TFW3_9BACT|nr:MAG: hypothetical protein COU46_01370 [Candidatus Niyogibacteria bacterium CG10_big_fil_rev_8_21_14_0_10_42_19]
MRSDEYKGNPSENPSEEEAREQERIEMELRKKERERGFRAAMWYFLSLSAVIYWIARDSDFLSKTILSDHGVIFTELAVPPWVNLIITLAVFYLVILFFTAYITPFCSKMKRMGRDTWASSTLILGSAIGIYLGMSLGETSVGFLETILAAHTLNFKDLTFGVAVDGDLLEQVNRLTWFMLKDAALMSLVSIIGIFSFLHFYLKEDLETSLISAAVIAIFYSFSLGIWIGMLNSIIIFTGFIVIFIFYFLAIKNVLIPFGARFIVPPARILSPGFKRVVDFILWLFGTMMNFIIFIPLVKLFSFIYKVGKKIFGISFFIGVGKIFIAIFSLPAKIIGHFFGKDKNK